ncbi:MAG: ABC transporter ATP-binding protein, partial [Neisseriaceae bacterium]|nr:ABC transporter ATP-binding protein [Neisseriaceae bacterium]
AKQLAQKVGYVPQAHQDLFPYLVLDMVQMGRTAHLSWFSTPGPKDQAIAHACLAQMGISHLSARRYTELSGGERQLVLIARALAQQPRLLIMDEPTASLDFGNQIRVLATIEQLKAQGLAILLTTHQPEHAHRVADRVVLLHQGQILANGKPAEVLTAAHLATLYNLEEAQLHQHLAFLTPTLSMEPTA